MNILESSIRGFLKEKFNRYLLGALLIVGIFAILFTGSQAAPTHDGMVVSVFYLPTCPHCAEQRPIIEQLQAELSDVSFIFYDASSTEGSALFYTMASEAGLDVNRLGVPTTFVGKEPLVGLHTREQIIEKINECIRECKENGSFESQSQEVSTSFSDYELPFIGRANLMEWSLPVLAITLGLIDGFNPCAMWVLVYLIGMLMGLNDRKKVWIIVGSFVAASGILYFIFMTAWLNMFLLLGYVRIITIIIGLVALGGGILSFKDYMETKGAMTCKVGNESDHQNTMGRIDKIVSEPLTIALIISIIALAFAVNSVEFLCSAAIPAVFTQILALNSLPAFQYYLYIALYVFFFMLDDMIIFGLAAFAVSSSLGNKYAKYCKLIGAVILMLLGIIMLFVPNLLR